MCTVLFTSSWLEHRSNRFNIGLDMFFTCDGITDNVCYAFTPVLENGSYRLELPSVLVAGRSRYRAMRWALWGSQAKIFKCYGIKKILKASTYYLYYLYKVQVNYQPWMTDARLCSVGRKKI